MKMHEYLAEHPLKTAEQSLRHGVDVAKALETEEGDQISMEIHQLLIQVREVADRVRRLKGQP